MPRNASLDILKVALAVMVVGIHAELAAESLPSLAYLLNNGVFRLAVPCFLLINGFFLHSAIEKGSFAKWFKRALILYVIWMLLYSYRWISWDGISATRLVKTWVIGYNHLWYLSGMLGGGVALYLLRRLPMAVQLGLAACFFLAGTAIQYLGNYHVFAGSSLDAKLNLYHYHRNAILLCYPFMLIGYCLSKYRVSEQVSLSQAFAGAAMGILLLLAEASLNYRLLETPDEFDNLAALALACPFLFLLASKLTLSANGKLLAVFSTALYLIHPAVIFFLEKRDPLFGLPLFVSTLAISGLIAFALARLHRWTKYLL